MRTLKVVVTVFCIPFLVGTSCINTFFFEVEYELTSCPSNDRTWPRPFNRLESTLELISQGPDCPGYSKYLLTRYKQDGGETSRSGAYLKLKRGSKCSISMAAAAPCSKNRDCALESEVVETVKRDAKDLADELWANQKFSTRSGSVQVRPIGRETELDSWCQSQLLLGVPTSK